MDSTFLQIFLIVNVFLIGGLTVVAFQHAYAHFRPHANDSEKPQGQAVRLPAEIKERLLRTSQANFQTILDHSAAELEHDLKATTTRLNKHLERLGLEIVGDETKRYRMELDGLRAQGETAISQAQTEFTTIIKDEMQRYHASLDGLRNQSEATIGGAQAEIAGAIKGETERYQTSLNSLRNQAETAIGGGQAEITGVLKNEVQHYQASLEGLRNKAETTISEVQTEITETIKNETQRYRASLDGLSSQTEVAISETQAEILGHQTEIKAKLAELKAQLMPKLTEEIALEKQHLIQQIDTKLADAMTSFLIDALQHNVDLGAQSDYLLATLEEHKADFTQEINDGI